jgi:ligand-binding SRPBCC domain-containing protein
MRHIFEKQSRIEATAEQVFAWHERPGALQRLIPPRVPLKIIEHTGGIANGARVELTLGYWPLQVRWIARHQNYIAGRRFEDVQERGPFARWKHTHTVTPNGPRACILRDRIEYELPFGPMGELAAGLVRRKLEATFAYRHRITIQENEQTKPISVG